MTLFQKIRQPNFFFPGSRQRTALQIAICVIGFYITLFAIMWQTR